MLSILNKALSVSSWVSVSFFVFDVVVDEPAVGVDFLESDSLEFLVVRTTAELIRLLKLLDALVDAEVDKETRWFLVSFNAVTSY